MVLEKTGSSDNNMFFEEFGFLILYTTYLLHEMHYNTARYQRHNLRLPFFVKEAFKKMKTFF